MRIISFLLAFSSSIFLSAQAPALIPYQAVARDGAGQPLSNAAINARFTIHNETANGIVVWQEVQTVNTNGLGLFTSQLGGTSSLAAVNWAVGSKFLQVELDAGSGFFEIGTQQMLSVPYALHAGSVPVNVSPTGDTLFVGEGNFVIIPGLSEANGFTTVTTIHSCGSENVHNPDLVYSSMTDQEGNLYKTIVIGTQEWMAENLNTSIYVNGDSIPTNLDDTTWQNTTDGAWAYYDNDTSYACPRGKLYNWYACADSRHLCPQGWHIPSQNDWTELTNSLGGQAIAGAKMKSFGTLYWLSSNTEADNSSGFSATSGGMRHRNGTYQLIGANGQWWSSTPFNATSAWNRLMTSDDIDVEVIASRKEYGFSVRCLRD
jgi:uncharacterized protein (TIGR02145 family)